ncbi:hypothetical protein ACP4OV_024097 [Aristida adscensionis]
MATIERKKVDFGGCCTWLVLAIVYLGLIVVVTSLPPMSSLLYPDEKPTACSVELVGAGGLEPAAPALPAVDLIVRVVNGHAAYYLTHDGGDVVVSYAGVPLARGRTPAFELAGKEAAALPVRAASAGAGVPEDLLRLMAEERRRGVAQVQVEVGVRWEAFVCDVDLGGRPRVSACYQPNYSVF